jgi:hypothetical protein
MATKNVDQGVAAAPARLVGLASKGADADRIAEARARLVQARESKYIQDAGFQRTLLETRAVDLAGLAARATTAGAISPQLVSYLALAGRSLAVAAVVYYTIKAVILLLAGTVAIFTKDEKRGQRCVQIVQAVSRGWPWPPRPPEAPG